MNRLLRLAACGLLALASGCAWAQTAPERPFYLPDGARVLFLGDSITDEGTYVSFVEAALRLRLPEQRFEVIEVGLASETASGLSEPAHPFPRPDVHDRLGRALQLVAPDVVVAGYGMNDAIYHPFDSVRFAAYQRGIQRLIDRVLAAGARLTLLTPPPFDAHPIRDRLRPAGADAYSWEAPYEDYDAVLARYSDWLTTLRRDSVLVVDLHTPLSQHVEAYRAFTSRGSGSPYVWAADGIHPEPDGHAWIAAKLLRAWRLPEGPGLLVLDLAEGRVVAGEAEAERSPDGLRVEWAMPLPLPEPLLSKPVRGGPRLAFARGYASTVTIAYGGTTSGMSRGGSGPSPGRPPMALPIRAFPEALTVEAAAWFDLVDRRRRLLSDAWLHHIGHERPGIEPGLPLPEAHRRAAELEQLVEAGARRRYPVVLTVTNAHQR